MTINVASTASTSVGTAATTIAATAPAGIADGDILIACVVKNTITAPSTVPSGWTLGLVSPFGNRNGAVSLGTSLTNFWYGIYWKVAASESGSYTWGSTSSIWQVQILRVTGYRSVKPGGVVAAPTLFMDGVANTRSVNTISNNNALTPWGAIYTDGALLISQFAQEAATTAPVFSALTGSMTSVANVSQNGTAAITQQVAWEVLDFTKNPNFGGRQVTTDTASGLTGGYQILIPDPSSITGWPVDKRNDLHAGYPRGKVVNK